MAVKWGEHGRWWNDQKAIDKLKLTDNQRKLMDDAYQAHRLKLVDLHGTLEKEELTMEPLIKADQPDESRVLSQIDKVAQARAELEKENARMLLDIRRQLTPEQWKMLEAVSSEPPRGYAWRTGKRRSAQVARRPGRRSARQQSPVRVQMVAPAAVPAELKWIRRTKPGPTTTSKDQPRPTTTSKDQPRPAAKTRQDVQDLTSWRVRMA